MAKTPVTVRSCNRVEEFEQMVDLQMRIWGYSERDAVPAIMFVVATKTGGQVIGAFAGETMVGFALAYPAIHAGECYLHSHMAAVLPQFRDQGVGRALKAAQRADALAREIRRIEWTFDPLQPRNAYFNICRLGVTIRQYLPNLYGCTSSPLHAGLPTDRLLAEWNLESDRVAEVLAGKTQRVSDDAERIRVALPEAASAQQLTNVQAEIRERFQTLFAQEYAVTWFERDENGFSYLLERRSPRT
jgi:predicted GNAT superfamily acetyltransferase